MHVLVKGDFRNLGHVGARRTPRVVTRRCRLSQLLQSWPHRVSLAHIPFLTFTWTDE